jgi:hypothetical protein
VSTPYADAPTGKAAFKLSAELKKELREALTEVERGECIVLTLAELEAWGETGEFPWPDESHD